MAGQSTDIGRYDFESDGSLPAFRDGRIFGHQVSYATSNRLKRFRDVSQRDCLA